MVSVIARQVKADPLAETRPVCTKEEILQMQAEARKTTLHDDISRYITALAEFTRAHDGVELGVSTRGCIALARVSAAYAAIQGREFVTPDDVKYLLPYVFTHRLMLRGGAGGRGGKARRVIEEALSAVPVPTEAW
jgi:MoxR-like ATPase